MYMYAGAYMGALLRAFTKTLAERHHAMVILDAPELAGRRVQGVLARRTGAACNPAVSGRIGHSSIVIWARVHLRC